MRLTRAAAFIYLAASLTGLLYGQPGQPPIQPSNTEIETDRPDVTESAVVVPAASLQFENGFAWTANRGKQYVDLSETLVRLGIFDKTELRVVVPNFIQGLTSTPVASGFGDMAIGMKRQIGPLAGGVDLSVIIAVSLPTGKSGVSTGGYDPFIKFPWSKDLAHGWSTGGMQSIFWNTVDNRRNGLWEATFYLEKQITKRSDLFAEYAGDYARHGGSQHLAHFGGAYRLNQTSQIDFHFGYGLNRETPNHLYAIGYSVRFDGLWNRR